METLLIAGAPDCGKSELIHLTARLLIGKSYRIVREFHGNVFNPAVCSDIETLFEKKGRHVLLHAATDTPSCIDYLLENLAEIPDPVDVLICACRRDGLPRQYLCDRMGWTNGTEICDAGGKVIPQLPLMRIRYENYPAVKGWYQQNLLGIVRHMLYYPPYSL